MGSEEHIPSSATVEQFTNAMREKAAAEYVDSAVDPDWKVLSSPDYPGRVDSKEWIKKRQLRHSHVCYKQHTSLQAKEILWLITKKVGKAFCLKHCTMYG